MDKPRAPHMGKSYFRPEPQKYLPVKEEIYRKQIYDGDKLELPSGLPRDTEFFFEKEWDRYNEQDECYIIGYSPRQLNPNYEAELTQYKIDKAKHDAAYDEYERQLKVYEKYLRKQQYLELKKEFE